MSDIDSIVSLVPKKKKNMKKLSYNSTHIHKSNSTPKPYISNNFNKLYNENTPNIITKYSQKILDIKKFSEEDIFFSKKSKNNNTIFSEKEFLQEEEDFTNPLVNLEKIGKPNYLMKSDYIKNKSLTPKENIFQHNLNPIYDFYKMDPELNSNAETNTNKKDKNAHKVISFTQLCDNFIKLNCKDNFENEQKNTINEINTEKYTPKNDEENNMEYNKNFFEKQNIGENTPASLGENFSPSNDFFDENIFNYENNINKSPLNYNQMNVNININNNQQNNNIYYHFPYIVNNVNSGNTNNNYYFNNKFEGINKNNNNDQNEFNVNEYLYEGNNNINNNMQMNEDMNLNELNQNFGNKNNNINIRQNFYDKNNFIYEQMNNNNNNFQINLDYNNNMNEPGYNTNNINYNNNIGNSNMNLNSDINSIKLNEILKYKNLENYLNNYSAMNNNNINNGNINYNIQLNNNIANKNKNFVQNIFSNNSMNNNNINNQLKYLQMLSNYNNNNIYNNQFPNLNQENLYFNNNKNIISYPNQNLQIYNNYNPYQNNLIDNMNINNYNNNMFNNNYNQDNNNIYEKNNLNLEQILIDIPPYELIDKCCVFAKFQSGCRFLQDYLTENANNSSLIKAMFEKILEHIKELSKGQFSHYFVKKILPLLNEFQRMKLIKTLSPVIEDISTNQYGTKIIQDIIDLIKTEKEYNLMLNIITPYIKQLIIDLNGTQIIYKLITKSKNRKIIEDCICKNIKEIALSKKGSNFLIKYFEFADEKDTLNIKKNILMNLKDIIMDQFGNYVIQHILLKTKSEILQNFVDEIKVNLILYSNNKFASNAVEKCFQNENIKNDVIKLFMVKDIFNSIILDKFGNYVAQRAIGAADDKDRKILIDLLKLIIPELKNKYFGEKLLSKIQFLYPNFF